MRHRAALGGRQPPHPHYALSLLAEEDGGVDAREWYQSLRCEVCERQDQEDRMVLCDGCDRGYHIHCMDPPWSRVPRGDWYCPACQGKHRWRNIARVELARAVHPAWRCPCSPGSPAPTQSRTACRAPRAVPGVRARPGSAVRRTPCGAQRGARHQRRAKAGLGGGWRAAGARPPAPHLSPRVRRQRFRRLLRRSRLGPGGLGRGVGPVCVEQRRQQRREFRGGPIGGGGRREGQAGRGGAGARW